MDLGLADAAVLVQGGSQGMGLAAARVFAAEGARVALLARTPATLEAAATSLRADGAADVLTLPADVGDGDAVTAAFATVTEQWGALNVLVNAVGPTSGMGPFEALSDEDWRGAFESGVLGMVRCVRAALPLLRAAQWARIVNLSASSTKHQTTALVAYTGVKAMVTSVTKNLSQSLAADEILVNTVSPGGFASAGLAAWAASAGIDPTDLYALAEGLKKHFGHAAALPRVGATEEIGAVIAFLGSRRNTYMTGANVNVDGGTDFS